MNLLEELQNIPQLSEVPAEQLQWLLDRSECQKFKKGENMFEPGDPIDRLLILLSGGLTFKVEKNNQFEMVSQIQAPFVTGLLPYSRATNAVGFGVTDEDMNVVALEKKHFHDMICECHDLTTVLVHAMSTRIRTSTKREQMNDKMMSLGKLSAGLAHELNNPSAAVVRSSKELSNQLKYQPENFKQVIKINMTDEQVDKISQILFTKASNGLTQLPMMERSSREEELIDWLYDNDIEDAEDIANNAVDYDFTPDDLDKVKNSVPEGHLDSILHWMSQILTIERLVGEIEDASERINGLVSSIKSYTHMDQAPEKVNTDVHVGLDNTLTMLNHKLKANKINVLRNYGEGLPNPKVLPGAINQVWTNILDNAIDAMEETEKRDLTLKTKTNGDFFVVAIEDTGSGIPDDIKDKIFDPFFTTKSIGKGTGLGLENVMDIVKSQHNGIIEVESKPGNTTFSISIPIEAA